MSELGIEKFNEILGADNYLYTGTFSPLDLVTGGAVHKLRRAIRARDIAAEAAETDGDAIGRIIGKLAKIIDSPEPTEELSTEQKDAIAASISGLVTLHDRTAPIGDHPAVIRGIFNTYFEHQQLLSGTEAGHILRVGGSDYAIQVGFDLDVSQTIYQQCLEWSEHRPS